jgi:hypothetical protein
MDFSERCADVEVVINTLINDLTATGIDDGLDDLCDAALLIVAARMQLKRRELQRERDRRIAHHQAQPILWADKGTGIMPCGPDSVS